ncbi:hypothetical protein J0A71_08g16860 [Encephalitozoon cuniculi]|nr:hypothetical protein J0A71_08g16860 [Encephalitozoon cuniculi]
MGNPKVNGILKIENVEITVEGREVCKSQRILAAGVCGITGLYNTLRDALIASLTIPAVPSTDLRLCGSISFGGSPMSYKELQKMMNPFVMFYSCESVQSSLEFVNFSKVNNMIDAFDLESIRKSAISGLTVSESRRWEAAISVASEAKIIVLRDFHSPYETTKKYLSFLGEYARNTGCLILVEVDFPLEYGLDGCITIGSDGFECTNFYIEEEVRRYRRTLFENFLRETEVKHDSKKGRKENISDVSVEDFLDSPTDVSGSSGAIEHTLLENTANLIAPCCQNASEVDKYSAAPGLDASSDSAYLDVDAFKDDVVVHKIQSTGLLQSLERKAIWKEPMKNCYMSSLKALFAQYFCSVDIRLSLLLTRRKCVLEERRTKDFKKFIVSFLMHVYLAIILKFKASIFNDAAFGTTLTFSGAFQSLLEVFREWSVFAEKLVKKILTTSICTVANDALHIPSLFFTSAVSIGRETMVFIGKIRSYNWDLVDYKIISTGIYFIIFTRGGTMVNEERAQVHSQVNRIYSPGTYFFHIFIYLVLKTWIPVLLVSYILSFNFAPIFLITGTFTCSLLNLVLNLKLKYMFMCITLAFNLLYPLDEESFRKSFFLRYSESFNFLVACRQFPLAPLRERSILLYRLLRAFLFIYLFFCYRFSRIRA